MDSEVYGIDEFLEIIDEASSARVVSVLRLE